MKIFFVLLISPLLTGGMLPAQCLNGSRSHARLQWSESAKLVSPNRVWELEVRPLLTSDENQSPVLLHKCRASSSRTLLTLQRSAEAYWGPDSRSLLIVNEPVANSNELLLFDTELSKVAADEAPRQIDEIVKQRLSQELGTKQHIEFYLPQFVSWKANDLLVSVGGATSSGGDGPMTAYCYGMRINSSTLHVESVLSDKQLKASTGHSCQVSP